MNWADWAILVILVVSSLISLKRGFVKEALSMVNWLLAFFIAMTFRDSLSALLASQITTPSVRDMVAFAILFAATLIVGAMVNYLIGEVVRMTGLAGTDRPIWHDIRIYSRFCCRNGDSPACAPLSGH